MKKEKIGIFDYITKFMMILCAIIIFIILLTGTYEQKFIIAYIGGGIYLIKTCLEFAFSRWFE